MFTAMFAVALCAISCETDGDLDDYTPPTLSSAEVSEYAPIITEIIPGYDRLQISWDLNATSSSIDYCYIFNGTDVIEIKMSDITPDNDGIYTQIVDMEEGSYDIYMKSLDSDNNLSGAGAKVSVTVYGDEYIASLDSHRKVLRSAYDATAATYTLTMSDSYDSTVTGVKVYYVASDDVAAADADFYTLTVTDGDYPSYVSCVEYAPSATSYTIPDAYDDMDIIIETSLELFDEVLDEIKITANKVLSDAATFVEVSSLETLRLYTTRETSNVNVKMTPGVYSFTIADATAKNYSTSEVYYGTVKPSIICIKGQNNNYDFTGVYIEIADDAGDNTGAGAEFGGMQITGKNNTVRGLNLIDLYEKTTTPSNGYTNVSIDGEYNTVEDIYVYSAGSTPYAYGEVFGKGSTKTISHNKHCSLLLRGDNNTIRRCTLLHHAYGHVQFMQGAKNATIEDCYFESEVCTTDDILAEAGTGTSADLVNFQTCYGYKLPSGYTLSNCEDAVRSYKSGTTVTWDTRYCDGTETVDFITIDGKTCYPDGYIYGGSRDTGSIYASGNTTKHSRSSSALYLGGNSDLTWLKSVTGVSDLTGSRYVANSTSIACQDGFSIRNSGRMVNCQATPVFGPVINMSYGDATSTTTVSSVISDIEFIQYDGDKKSGNGQGQAARVWGGSHTLEFKVSADYKYDDFTMNTHYMYNADGKLYIAIGGTPTGVGSLTSSCMPDFYTPGGALGSYGSGNGQDNQCSNSKITNYADFLMVISPRSNNNTIYNYGNEEIIVSGYNNKIYNYGTGKVVNLGTGNTVYEGEVVTTADGYPVDYRAYKAFEDYDFNQQ